MLSRVRLESLAKLAIGINLAHIFCSFVFRKQFFPGVTPAFPNFVQILFGIEFGLAGIVVSRVFYKVKYTQVTQSEVGAISVTSAVTTAPPGLRAVSGSDWRWMVATVLSFICTCAVLFSIHPPKFVQ
jgi:hypothetical protein